MPYPKLRRRLCDDLAFRILACFRLGCRPPAALISRNESCLWACNGTSVWASNKMLHDLHNGTSKFFAVCFQVEASQPALEFVQTVTSRLFWTATSPSKGTELSRPTGACLEIWASFLLTGCLHEVPGQGWLRLPRPAAYQSSRLLPYS